MSLIVLLFSIGFYEVFEFILRSLTFASWQSWRSFGIWFDGKFLGAYLDLFFLAKFQILFRSHVNKM